MAMNLSDAFIGEPNHDGAAVVWCGCAVDQTNVDQRLNGLRYSAGRERNGLSQSFDAKPLGMNELKLMENLPGCRRDKAVNFFRLMPCVADLFARAPKPQEEFRKVGGDLSRTC